MLTIFLMFLKSAFTNLINLLSQALSLFLQHWRVLLPALIAIVILIYINSLRSDISRANKREAVANKALIDHVEADSQAAKKREAENKLNAILAQKKTAADLAKHKAELSKIIAKGKTNEAITNRVISNYRDSLRDKISSQAAIRLLEDDTNRLASTDNNATVLRPIHEIEAELATCKEAGAVCAADYNLCKSYVDNQQSIIGVSE